MIKKLCKSVLCTSVPMIALAYFYGTHGVWIWLTAFFCGMMFQADITFRELAKFLWNDFRRDLKFWR